METIKKPEIRITALPCGTMSVRPYEADIRKKNPLLGRVTLPVNAFLVEHPKHGNVLIDTGWSRDVSEILPAHLKAFYRPRIGAGESAVERLEAMGLRPEDIDTVLLTHLDIDHTCALRDFAGRAGRIVCAELEYFYSCRYVYKMRQVWDTWMPYLREEDRIHYHGCALGPTGRGFDLFGDDSVLCIYTPGHTDGMFAVIVNQSPSFRFAMHGDGGSTSDFAVIAADAAFSEENLRERSVPGYGFNRQHQLKSIDFLRSLAQDRCCRAMFFSHAVPEQGSIVF